MLPVTRSLCPAVRLLRLVVVLLLTRVGFAQTPGFDVLSRANGLPSDYVFGLDQDAQGFLWLATDAGVARYDGRSVRTWTTADGLPSNLVYSVRATPDGAIWAGTYEGAARRSNGGRFEPVETGEAIHRFHADAFGRVYLIGERLHVWERGRVRLLQPAASGRAAAPKLRSDTFVIDLSSKQVLNVQASPDTVVARISEPSADTLGSPMGMSPWTLGYRNAILEVYRPPQPTPVASLPSSRILVAVPFRQDWLVSTLSTGVLRWDGTALTPFLTAEQLNRQAAYAALQDYEGALWLGLFGGGAWRLSGQYRTLPGRDDARLAAPFVHLSRDRAGLHAATRSHLYTLDDRLRIVHTYDVSQVGRIAHARDGTAFVVSGIYLRNAAGRRLLAESNWFSSARFDGGDTLWLGTYGGGLRRRVRGRELPAMPLPHGVQVVEDLVPGTHGAMWVLTRSHGALRYQNGRWTAFGRREGLSSDAVFSLFEAPDRTVWLGTDLGLVRIRTQGARRHVRMFDDRGRLRGQRLHAIAAIGDTVWAIGDRTAYAIVGDSMRAFAAAPLLPASDLVIYDAEILPETRRAVLATSDGLMAVDLTRLDVTLPPPRVALVQVDGRDVDAAPDTLRLAPSARGVALTFAPLTFVAPTNARLQTRADNEAWSVPTLDRTVSLVALTDGWHRLEVRAVNVAGTPSTAPLVLHIYVPAPWWRTLWARLLWLLMVVGIVASITRWLIAFRRRQAETRRAQQQRVQDERDRIARELHDHVGAQLSGVLAGLQLLDPQTQPPEDLVPALRDEVRHTIGALRTTLWTLRYPPTTVAALGEHLGRYVRDQSRLYPHLALSASTFDLPEAPLPPLGALHVFRIGQEALRNALHHARASHVHMALTWNDGLLALRIEDDGRFVEPSDLGHGLASMRSRAAEIGATFALDGTDEGTTVRLTWKPGRFVSESPERTTPSGPARP